MKIFWYSIATVICILAGIFFYHVVFLKVQTYNYSPARQNKTHVQEEKRNLIILDSIKNGDRVSSPLHITGKARGTWYFEASFPITVLNSEQKEIGSGHAVALTEWMTTDFVPFVSDITFSVQHATSGTLVFKKDNPSGDPAHDDSISIPVVFTGR